MKGGRLSAFPGSDTNHPLFYFSSTSPHNPNSLFLPFFLSVEFPIEKPGLVQGWGAWAGAGLLACDIPPHLTHPAVHLLAEVVVPAAICQDFSTVFTSTQLVALPVVWLSDSPVPKKTRQSSSSDLAISQQPCPQLQKNTALEGFRERRSSLGGSKWERRGLRIWSPKDLRESVRAKSPVDVPNAN